jgi:hypothetical protein
LAATGFLAAFQPDPTWADPGCLRRRVRRRLVGMGMLLDGFRPDRFNQLGVALCLPGWR